RAASSWNAMIPGTVETGADGRAAATPSASDENVEYTLGSPSVTKATRSPASRRATTWATTASRAAWRAAVSTSMTNTTRSQAAFGATSRTTASARPMAWADVDG